MTSKEKALVLAEATERKKSFDLRILDLREANAFTDFFVIATGTSDRHVRALADAAIEAAEQYGERPIGVEGQETARWLLIDLGDVLVHLFQHDARVFYGLERLWGEAESIELPQAAAAAR